MDCERIAEFSPTGGPESWAQSERAIRGFAEILLRHQLLATLFITPETAAQHRVMFSVLFSSILAPPAAGHGTDPNESVD